MSSVVGGLLIINKVVTTHDSVAFLGFFKRGGGAILKK